MVALLGEAVDASATTAMSRKPAPPVRVVPQTPARGSVTGGHRLLALQRVIGNRAVGELIARSRAAARIETSAAVEASPAVPRPDLVARLERSIMSAGKHLGPDLMAQLEQMLSPEALMMTAAFIATQFVGLGEAADAVGFAMLVYKIGNDAVQVATDVAAFASITYRAISEEELEVAGLHLAHAITLAGIDTLMVLLAARSSRAGERQAELKGKSLPPESAGASPRGDSFQSASAKTARSTVTAIRSDIGESEAYKGALRRAEIGLERPQGANVSGRADFITARRATDGQWEIVVTDVKTTTTGRFPAPENSMPTAWGAQIRAAISPTRLDLGDATVEGQIRAAYRAGRVGFRQVNVDYSPAGGGSITGF